MSSLPFSCFKNSAVESFDTATSVASDPTSIYYLEEHGYLLWDIDNGDTGFKLYSLLYGNGLRDPVLHIDLNIDHKVTTIFDNNLDDEKPDEKNLKLEQIFHGLCYKENIDFNEMNWIVMDVNDWSINDAIRSYRRDNHLTHKVQIRVTPQDKGWSTFSEMHYYKSAAKMIPEKRKLTGSLWYSGKWRHTNVDPVEARAAELAAEDNLEAAVEIAANAAAAHENAMLEGGTESCPDTGFDN
ncbi:hypothetical protein CFIMG_006505RA [Ceratocystis fimbriata CBS 114723]|uniref:Uncharacterized protein n=1 Tax=Ceratocystis fimbriata CBS 114723 TaxID=1035309 RepID=A0A2C5WUK0_9PEZI|nr:hypothetical protein CFIMG_006505RA [Ceratocystis fimbriata CBS 114723]